MWPVGTPEDNAVQFVFHCKSLLSVSHGVTIFLENQEIRMCPDKEYKFYYLSSFSLFYGGNWTIHING